MIDLTALRAALFAWFDSASSVAVIWGQQNGPPPPHPYVVIEPLSTPQGDRTRDERRYTLLGTIKIATVTPGATYTLTAAAQTLSYASDLADTIAEILAGLISAVNTDPIAGLVYKATAKGADGIRLERLAAAPSAFDHASTDPKLVLDTIKRELVHGNRSMTLTIMTLAQRTDDPIGALDEAIALSGEIHDAMVTTDAQIAFEAAGVALLRREPAVDLSSVEGAAWEARIAFDARFGLASTVTTEVPWIETLAMTASVPV